MMIVASNGFINVRVLESLSFNVFFVFQSFESCVDDDDLFLNGIGKRANVDEDEIGRRLQSLLDKLTDQKAWRIDYEQGSYGSFTKCDDDDEIEKTSSASSPTSVLKSKGSVSEDCFCCSKQMTEEEEEVYDDASDNWDDFRDALNSFENDNNESPRLETEDIEQEEDLNPNTSQRRNKSTTPEKLFHKDNSKHEASPEKTIHRNSKKKKRSNSGKQEGDEECPICSEVMDATDLTFQPCPCGFRICLFCHKKISENEARCPSCRKEYAQTSNNSGEVGFQQRGRGTIRLSPSFRGLDRA